ncbi:MAG: SDR family oxidoreductase [Nitrospiraceae bacterium]|nr:SDR family oxidoreductase [Nitrospiraceae bacterium]
MLKKVALITGASRGLGRTIALTLARQGYAIGVNYLSSSAEAEEVARLSGNGSCAIRADVGDAGQVAGMAAEIERRFGRLDAVINNAGISRDALLVRQTEEDWDSVVRTNLSGCLHVIRQVAPLMVRSGGGHIVNIASHSGMRGKAGQAAYSASKAALLGLTVCTAVELGESDIRVNAVMPGYLDTGMGGAAAAARQEAIKRSLLGSLSSAEEAAGFIAWLLTTSCITGQVFSLDSRII